MLLTLYYLVASWMQTWRLQRVCAQLARLIGVDGQQQQLLQLLPPQQRLSIAFVAEFSDHVDAASTPSTTTTAVVSKEASDKDNDATNGDGIGKSVETMMMISVSDAPRRNAMHIRIRHTFTTGLRDDETPLSLFIVGVVAPLRV